MIRFPVAKINLGLRVLYQRPDSYHAIESVFYPVGIHDILEIVPSPDGRFAFTSTGIPVPGETENNLVTKAYRTMKEAYGLPDVHIHLHKFIPMGSGMGGGSSDASSALVLLDSLFKLGLSHDVLQSLALTIGSDCPYFIDPRPSLITGRGEIIEPIPVDLSAYDILIVFPGISISTKEAYIKVKPLDGREPLKELMMETIDHWKENITNDFEAFVFNKYPETGLIKQQLYAAGAVYASLTGSGSALYGIFKPGLDTVLLPKYYNTYLCKATSRV